MKPSPFHRKNNLLLILALLHLLGFFILGLFPHFFSGEEGILPFTAQGIDMSKSFRAPSWQLQENFFGTDHLGRDVLAGIIYGCRTSLVVCVPAITIAALAGLLLGLSAGFFGNDRISVQWHALLLCGVVLCAGLYYSFYVDQYSLKQAFDSGFISGLWRLVLRLSFIGLAIVGIYKLLGRSKTGKVYPAPIDEMVLKLIELFSSIPRLVLVLALAAFLQPSVSVLVLILGFTSWTGMARLARGEVIRVKVLPYIEAAKALGLKDRSIVFHHVLPNILPVVLVSIAFGLANLLALEATLSFLGIGLPPDEVSWGKTISSVRHNFSAWWLVVFPGGYLSLTVLSLHYCSNYLLDRNRP